jgi:hypothetical protein
MNRSGLLAVKANGLTLSYLCASGLRVCGLRVCGLRVCGSTAHMRPSAGSTGLPLAGATLQQALIRPKDQVGRELAGPTVAV